MVSLAGPQMPCSRHQSHRPPQASAHQAGSPAHCPGLQPVSSPCSAIQGTRRTALCVTKKWRVICFYQTLFLSLLSTLWLLSQSPPLNGAAMASPFSTENLPLLPVSLSISPFFLPRTGNCETVRESPGVFSSKRSPAVLRGAQSPAVNVTLSPCSCTCQ